MIVLGHRGGRGPGWPRENTLEAFERARREGADGVELDLRPCLDDMVVMHDATLERTHGLPRRVADLSARELRALGVPTLDEVLAFRRGMVLNVELKRDVGNRVSFARAAARRLDGDVIVSSFDPVILATVAAVAPSLQRALLTHAKQRSASSLLALARPPLVSGAHIECPQATPERIRSLKRRGLRLGVWTVNDFEQAYDLAQAGVDLVITDRPAVIGRPASPRD